MSTGRKVGILAIVVLFGGIAAYWATQGDAAGPRVSNAQTPGDGASADDAPPAGVHDNDPSMTGGERSADDDRRHAVLDALRDTAPTAGGAAGEGGAGRDASTDGGIGDGSTSEGDAADGAAGADGVIWPTSNAGEDVGSPARQTYPPDTDTDTDRDPFSTDDLPADATAADATAAGGDDGDDDDAATGSPTAGGTDADDASDNGFTPRRWTQRTDDDSDDPSDDEPIGPPARDQADGAAEADGEGTRNTYTVEPGDSLWVIASKTLGSGANWQKIADANPEVDKNTVLRPGMTLHIPRDGEADDAGRIPEPRQVAEPTASDPLGLGLDRDAREVTVRENESLWTIAQREYGDGTKWRVIYLANRDRMDDQQDLHPGDKLRVPPLPEDD